MLDVTPVASREFIVKSEYVVAGDVVPTPELWTGEGDKAWEAAPSPTKEEVRLVTADLPQIHTCLTCLECGQN